MIKWYNTCSLIDGKDASVYLIDWIPTSPDAFFEEAAFYNHYNERDIDRYHWNTAKFKTLWRTKFAVLMARERGRIGSDAALGDMPKRLQAHSYDEMNEGPAR